MAKPFQFSTRTMLIGMTGIAILIGVCSTVFSVLPFILAMFMLVIVYLAAWGTTGASFGVDQSETIKGLAFGALTGLSVGCLALYPIMAVYYLVFALGGMFKN
jgi:hypothetical protein